MPDGRTKREAAHESCAPNPRPRRRPREAPCNEDCFKACRVCDLTWATREEMLGDPDVRLLGYQAFTADPGRGLLLFNHRPCRTTLAVRVAVFEDLYAGPIFSRRLAGTAACTRQCFQVGNLDPCAEACASAWVRDVLQTVRHWPKRADGAPWP